MVDRHGLPLAVRAHAANHHEVKLLQLSFDVYMIEEKPGCNFIDHKAFDYDALDAKLREEGIVMTSPLSRIGRTRKRKMGISRGKLSRLCVDRLDQILLRRF